MSNSLWQRREILKLATGGLTSALGPWSIWQRALLAADSEPDNDRVLILIQLSGGNDGLNTVIPTLDDRYYRERPALAIPRGTGLRLDDHHSLHPSLSGLRELWDEGRLAIIEGVGYPQPNRSHFRSMDIWQAADFREDPRSGWIGRSLDHDNRQRSQPREVAALGTDRPPLAVAGEYTIPLCVRDRQLFQLATPAALPRGVQHPAWSTLLTRPREQPLLEFLRQSATAAQAAARRMSAMEAQPQSSQFPDTHLGRQLHLVSQMIAADLPTRIYLVTLDGFDTHAQQLAGHAALLRELSEAVTALTRSLIEQRCEQRVLLATFSEFGRRVAENGSLGTDHGAASVMFAITPPGHGGMYGRAPSLTDLDDGDLKFTTDFRSVYATLLEDWLNIDSAPILGGHYEKLGFARG